MKKIAVLGAGSWGTALSMVLADNGFTVSLWSHRQEQADKILNEHTNQKYLPGVVLSDLVQGTGSLREALSQASAVLLVVPAKAMRDVLRQIRSIIEQPMLFIHGVKGIEPGSFKRMSEVIEEEVPASLRTAIVVLSGPSHAEEVALRHPTTVAVASSDFNAAQQAQDFFFNHYFRVYTNEDTVGVEIGGALKNIIALGAGLLDGLGYGDNAKAALITRGLAEISRLGTKMGAHPLTFIGLTGMGDLIVTCTSVHSRNWRAGNLLGKGEKLDSVLQQMGMVVEGVRTAEAAYALAKKMNIEMPITTAIYQVLFDGKHPKDAVDELMNRDKKDEIAPLSHSLAEKIAREQ
ncbi:NAD(P)H-dependent glycerol-3-phosphate dehydrogenase [Sporolactobacillus shoreicorticis]|uniref:Glycerol-3-phosphate dehydrogenase [NAD(P)+] n=1 Tax=Sporolactobacillus shoreicorticis TaxID=1923877 RepID=A0ABW5S1K5_9BACL|nr:NAD(P)H-dependent glycerol-3-phosphate dehydrogenase [Sporolactobacillus shoreicorticis]MCO7127042.1 NAD(P)H-dependent glycerol-3-phosphate dehydrogenase [Sporolactobacillus shoreicorticis]